MLKLSMFVKGDITMSKLLSLEFVGLPPTVNTMYRNSGSHRYKRQEVRDWQEEISGILSEHWEGQPYFKRACVSIEFTVKSSMNWDIDNRLKSLLDCLEIAGILANDNQIDGLNVRRYTGDQNKTKITVMEFR